MQNDGGVEALPGQPVVSVVIPTLDAGQGLAGLLEAVHAQQVPGGVELVVIDSGSRDGTPERARGAGARVLSIPRRHFDHGRARNQAIAASSGEFVALTVQDAMPADVGWLGRLLAPLLGPTEVAGSYGLQVAPPSAGLLERTRSSLWCEAHGEPRLQSLSDPEALAALEPEERLEQIRFDNVTSCIRRKVWEAIPFPEGNFGEDMGWARAVLLAGHKLACVPSARVWHSHERGWFYELRRSYVDGRNRVRLVDWPPAGLDPGEGLAVLRRLAFFVRTRRFDRVSDVLAGRRFLREELRRYETLDPVRPTQVYLEALGFGMALTERAARLRADGQFREGEWIRLFRFALAVSTGRALGTSAAARKGASPGVTAFWGGLDQLLGRTV